jgi:nucleotide-binding universal stress UspA family protein
MKIRKILHPTDFSPLSKPAFEMACSLARDYGAELVICHVCPPAVMAAGEGMLIERSAEETEQAEAELEAVQPADILIPVSHRLLQGGAADEIVRLARASKIDLIVMGTHGRSGFGRLLMGSVAEAVMRKAPCPVLTLKTPVPKEQEESEAATPRLAVASA